MMANMGRGVVAGFIATLILTALMLLRRATGIWTEYYHVELINVAANNLIGTPLLELVGWLLHFTIGVVLWGVLYALLCRRLPGRSPAVKGFWFGTGAWFLMMITVAPLAGSGFFGLGFGIVMPLVTLVSHWIYGILLGMAYNWLSRPAEEPAASGHQGRTSRSY